MEFKKCERCGSFFVSTNNICGNCLAKEHLEIVKLKDYFNENEEIPSITSLVHDTGISEKNITKYLQNNNFVEGQEKIFEL